MRPVISFKEKVRNLKRVEVYCYQIAYYILQDEAFATKAAEEALIRLYHDSVFFEETSEVQRNFAKKITIHTSIQIKVGKPFLRLVAQVQQ